MLEGRITSSKALHQHLSSPNISSDEPKNKNKKWWNAYYTNVTITKISKFKDKL